jgi:cytochrome b subunit of formate dehydrogenase
VIPVTAIPPDVRPVPIDAAQRGEGRFVWRFHAFHRWTHAAVIVSFLLLVITGLPLRFSDAFWAPSIIAMMGGVEAAGVLHRIGALVTFAYFGAHLTYLVVKLARAPDPMKLLWGPDSLVPQPRDVVDFWNQLRWYFGQGPRPRFGRWSYMEKFDYFAVFWGVAIIGGSGLMLWFPEFFARFVPGWVFNVATIVHGDEALLASGFIFTIHFFHVHFRPEKFPIDTVMFTGRATVTYMEEEHPEILGAIRDLSDQPTSDQQIPDTPAPPPTSLQTFVAVALGFSALAVGVALTGMILWAVLLS